MGKSDKSSLKWEYWGTVWEPAGEIGQDMKSSDKKTDQSRMKWNMSLFKKAGIGLPSPLFHPTFNRTSGCARKE